MQSQIFCRTPCKSSAAPATIELVLPDVGNYAALARLILTKVGAGRIHHKSKFHSTC